MIPVCGCNEMMILLIVYDLMVVLRGFERTVGDFGGGGGGGCACIDTASSVLIVIAKSI